MVLFEIRKGILGPKIGWEREMSQRIKHNYEIIAKLCNPVCFFIELFVFPVNTTQDAWSVDRIVPGKLLKNGAP